MTYSQLITWINQKAKSFHAADEDWEYEEIELDVIHKIFQYCIDHQITFEGFDLETLLNAEDDEDLPGNRYDMMFDLMKRISGDGNEGNVEVPEEVVKLIDHFNKTFYPDFNN
jgi:hypothetical protein